MSEKQISEVERIPEKIRSLKEKLDREHSRVMKENERERLPKESFTRDQADRIIDILYDIGNTNHPAAIRPLLDFHSKLKVLHGHLEPSEVIAERVGIALDMIYEGSKDKNHPAYRAMNAIAPHLSPRDPVEIEVKAIRQAIKTPNRFRNPAQVKLFIKQLRAMHGRVK